MSMMRKFIKLDELLDLINNELLHHNACNECRFSTIAPLENTDDTGCNWSHANLNCKGYPASLGQLSDLCQSTTGCQSVAARVIAEAKQHYNVR